MAHGSNILPVYILADESGSLGPHLEEINQGLEAIVSVLASDPLAAAKIRLSVIGFADIATVRLRLADVRKLPTLPPLQTGGSSNYRPAFSALRKLIPEDVAELKSEGYAVHRPAAFFLSDGQPSDGDQWRTEHQQWVCCTNR